eukprot:SAG22_NODE_122_length_18920_cov_23.494076_4_plen_97_part_00
MFLFAHNALLLQVVMASRVYTMGRNPLRADVWVGGPVCAAAAAAAAAACAAGGCDPALLPAIDDGAILFRPPLTTGWPRCRLLVVMPCLLADQALA